MLFSGSILANSFVFMMYMGVCMGVLYDILKYMRLVTLKNNFITVVCDIIFATIFVAVFLVGIQFCNYGQIRLFLILTYIVGFVIEKITIGDLVAKFIKYVYNLGIKISKNLAKRLKKEKYDGKQT